MIGRLHLGKLRSLAAEAMHTHFLGKLSALYSRSVPLLLPSGIMYIWREEDGGRRVEGKRKGGGRYICREEEGGGGWKGVEVQAPPDTGPPHTALGNWRGRQRAPLPTASTPHTCSPSCTRYGYDRCQGSSSTIPMCSKLSPPSVLTAAPMSPC